MAKFEIKDGQLYIDDKLVIKAFESFTGWYWFATEKDREQISIINGEEVKDIIYFGFVQGLEEEWGYFSEREILSLAPKTWVIPTKNVVWAGRR